MDLERLNGSCSWKDLTEGMQIYQGGTSREFHTGEWTTVKPVFLADKCKQCLLCVPVCPDSAIPVKNKERQEFDYDHCKGCGICVKACPFDAIEMEGIK
ncbi:MAG TPA: 4Fe-4S binding protein [Candidatus Blautia gallistercoris]|uniref:4Fe-4S binding protein n=1 Tax=Candidatus Blautia gallistercoris TaxID=2838490 RepID=A0A9D2B321_9FIRM|nr:4Fe-4S binding protein [Candidatus Blautia gallistercoris]